MQGLALLGISNQCIQPNSHLSNKEPRLSTLKINSTHCVLEPVIPDFELNVLKNEPMLFNCDLAHARQLGGPITNTVLDQLPNDWQTVPLVVDSRVHMLMPGWYPCIPGWHHDDVPRTRSDGQPNYGPGQYRSEHIVCLVNGDVCPTAFASGEMEFEEPALGAIIYRDWHLAVEKAVSEGRLILTHAPSNRLVQFDDRSFHTGTKAVKNGWRFFIRMSRYYKPDGTPTARGNARTNEVRRQVQVYLENPNDGW